jgi:hypothetical protein
MLIFAILSVDTAVVVETLVTEMDTVGDPQTGGMKTLTDHLGGTNQ